MTRLGTVLVFKDGTTEEEAAQALESIRRLLDVPKDHPMNYGIHEFDPTWGGPVWYIP